MKKSYDEPTAGILSSVVASHGHLTIWDGDNHRGLAHLAITNHRGLAHLTMTNHRVVVHLAMTLLCTARPS